MKDDFDRGDVTVCSQVSHGLPNQSLLGGVDLSFNSNVDHDARGEEFHKAGNEKLLALLNEMARGPSGLEDSTTFGSMTSHGGLNSCSGLGGQMTFAPSPGAQSAQSWQEDAGVHACLAECGEAWGEVQLASELKAELQARLMGELRQIQERSERQYQETSSLMQRLIGAKIALAEKLKEASAANQDLRDRISHEWQGNERLRTQISDGVKGMFARGAELSREIGIVGQSQSRLIEELQAATCMQTQLQQELQQERVATWRQSTDVVMAFARGGGDRGRPDGPATPPPVPTSPGSRRRLASPVLAREMAANGGAVPSASSSGRPQCAAEKKRHDDLQMQLWTECSALVRARAEGSEEQTRSQRQCWQQTQRIAELGKDLALEEVSSANLRTELEEASRLFHDAGLEPPALELSRAASRSSEGSESPEPPRPPGSWVNTPHGGAGFASLDTQDSQLSGEDEVPNELQHGALGLSRQPSTMRWTASVLELEADLGEDIAEITASLEEVEELRRELAERDSRYRDIAETRKAVILQEDLKNAEAEAELEDVMENLGVELGAERAALKHAEEHAAKQRTQYKMHIEHLRQELAHAHELTLSLADELHARSNGCFRRRRHPELLREEREGHAKDEMQLQRHTARPR